MPNTITKDPDAVIDVKFDWKALTNESGDSDWLASGETIQSTAIAKSTGITKNSASITDTNTSVTVWLSGGTADNDYSLACKITTSAGRTDERTMKIKVRNR